MNRTLLPLMLITPALAGTPQRTACFDSPTPIPDNAASSVQIALDLGPPNALLVRAVWLDLTIMHPWVGDLHATLAAPDGTAVTILNRPGLANPPGFDFPGPHGCGGDNINATFSDDAPIDAQSTCSPSTVPVLAGPLRPAQPLAALTGLPASGVWTITIADLGPTDAGTLTGACLRFDTSAACSADLAAPYGVLDFFDVVAFLQAFTRQLPAADFATPSGVFDFFDVVGFLTAYGAGCP